MDRREYTKLIDAKWKYMMMRPGLDKEYHDGVDVAQLQEWRKEWLMGRCFGLVNPVPDYKQDSFDCDNEVIDFIAFCHRKNAGTGKGLPVCLAALTGHAVMMFVEKGSQRIGFFDVRKGAIAFDDLERPGYLELV